MIKNIFCPFVLLIINGCSDHLVYVHEASLGVDFHLSPSDGTGKLAIGYDRGTYALVPKLKDESEAMSAAGFSRVHVEGIDNIQFAHAVATGDSAQALAENPDEIKRLVKKIFVDESNSQDGEKQ